LEKAIASVEAAQQSLHTGKAVKPHKAHLQAVFHEFSDRMLVLRDKSRYCLLAREAEGAQSFDLEQARLSEVPTSFKSLVQLALKPALLEHLIYHLNWSAILKRDDSFSGLYNGLVERVFGSIAESLTLSQSGNLAYFKCPLLETKLFTDYAITHVKDCLKRIERSMDLQMNDLQLSSQMRQPLKLIPELKDRAFCSQDPNLSVDELNFALEILVDLQE